MLYHQYNVTPPNPRKSEIEEIHHAILNNDPIEDKLHVIMVISNPCQYQRRFFLAKEFIARMEKNSNIHLYIVELAYIDQEFHVTDSNNPKHLQLRTQIPLWHKENMVNLGVKYLLPDTWKAFAWIDADIDFDNVHWANDTLRILRERDVVQLFTHIIDLNKQEDALNISQSFCYQYTAGKEYHRGKTNYWHPGYAWACTRTAYEKIGGLLECCIVGGGDYIMATSLIGKGVKYVYGQLSRSFIDIIKNFETNAQTLKLGYVPGVIRHFYHGSRLNRRYVDRWKILIDNGYYPSRHITKNDKGLIVPTSLCPQKILIDIQRYFRSRNEDEEFHYRSK